MQVQEKDAKYYEFCKDLSVHRRCACLIHNLTPCGSIVKLLDDAEGNSELAAYMDLERQVDLQMQLDDDI